MNMATLCLAYGYSRASIVKSMSAAEDIRELLGYLRSLARPSPLERYVAPFLAGDEPFVCYYDFLPNKEEVRYTYSRSEFWTLAMRFASALVDAGLRKGDHHVHYFSGNTLADLALRLASVRLGTVPVTVNWQADTQELISYKIEITNAKAIFVDSGTPDVEQLRSIHPHIPVIAAADIEAKPPVHDLMSFLRSSSPITDDDVRCVIFTSGTTGKPKGVELSYGNYNTNRETFESFLQLADPEDLFVPLVVNPMHHTNSTSITDWSLRRPNTVLHLVHHYTTKYWDILIRVHQSLEERGAEKTGLKRQKSRIKKSTVVAPLVSRHIDFLDTLYRGSMGTPIDLTALSSCLNNTVLLLGSAPVGPTTIERLEKYAGRLPTVRFGSTETTLQVCGIPLSLSQDYVLSCFRRGWAHLRPDGSPCQGFYIGRQHPPFTEVAVVKSIKPHEDHYLERCPEGHPGYIITRGGHIFKSYVGLDPAESAKAKTLDGWYLRLGDIGFWLSSSSDPACQELYWQSRDSQMLIRGGANYAYEQVNEELSKFIMRKYNIPSTVFTLAVCGIRVLSEHEDECCVMLQPSEELPAGPRASLVLKLTENFLRDASSPESGLSKGAKPDRFAVGNIPMVASKGVVNTPQLVQHWTDVASRAKEPTGQP